MQRWKRCRQVLVLQHLALLFSLEPTAVESQGWQASPHVNQAASCLQLEALLNNPSVTEVVLTKQIVANECSWTTLGSHQRHVSIGGLQGAALDLRGHMEESGVEFGELITLSQITLLGDSSQQDIFGMIAKLSKNQLWIDLDRVVIRDASCMGGGGHGLGMRQLVDMDVRLDMCRVSAGIFRINSATISTPRQWKMSVTNSILECNGYHDGVEDTNAAQACPPAAANESESIHAIHVWLAAFLFLTVLVALGCVVICAIFRSRKRLLEISAEDSNDKKVGAGTTKYGQRKLQNRWLRCLFVLQDPQSLMLDDLELHNTIGKGAFSTVYHAMLNGKPVAVKVFETQSSCLLAEEPLEALVGCKIVHPNLVRSFAHRTFDSCQIPPGYESSDAEDEGKFFSSNVSDAFDFVEMTRRSATACSSRLEYASSCVRAHIWPKTWLVMEYCSMGSLSSAMAKGLFCENQDRKSPRVFTIVQAAVDVARAMEHLHSKGVIHGDLKSQNVLLQHCQENGREFICKVGDFGLSRLVLNSTHIETFTCGSVRAMPPELLKDGILTPAADVYSFGILLWELLSGHSPYKGWSHQAILHNVVRGRRPFVPPTWPHALSDLVRDCVLQDYSQRPSFSEILERLNETHAKQNQTLFDSQPYCIFSPEDIPCEPAALSIEVAESPRFDPVVDSATLFSLVSQETSTCGTN